MVTKSDCLSLLFKMRDEGIDCSDKINELLKQSTPSAEIVAYINKNRQLDVQRFYEKLRKSYNENKSNLYINLVKEEQREPKEYIITLASLNLQILLFAKTLEEPQMFLRHARLEEINTCLLAYSKTYDLKPCMKILNIIKSDLKVLKESEKE